MLTPPTKTYQKNKKINKKNKDFRGILWMGAGQMVVIALFFFWFSHVSHIFSSIYGFVILHECIIVLAPSLLL